MSVPEGRTPSQEFPPDPIPRILLGGSVNLLAGMPGVGKSAFLAWFLVRMRDGLEIFGHRPTTIAKMAIVSVDRSWHQSSQLWLELAGFGDIAHYCLQDDMEFVVDRLENKRGRMQILREALDRLTPLPFGSLVVVDPIAPFLGGNLLDYDACMVACTKIRRVCRERGITIIGVSHAGKQKNDKKERYLRLQDRIVGSTAQFGYTDTAMYLASPEETGEKFYTFMWNPHHAPAAAYQLGRSADGLFVPWGESSVAIEEDTLLKIVPETPDGVSFADLITTSGLSKATVHRRLQELVSERRIERVGHGTYRRKSLH